MIRTKNAVPSPFVRAAALAVLIIAGTSWIRAQTDLELGDAVVVTADRLAGPESKAISLLLDEVERRTLIRWNVSHQWPPDSTPVIAVGSVSSLERFGGRLGGELALASELDRSEAFQVQVDQEKRAAPTVWIIGSDGRGVLFGVGRFLREARLTSGQIRLSDSFAVSTSPRYPIRGHQMGYRPKTNSYDAWTPQIWEQYIRDLIVFGINAVELIPPRSDDAADSPHFPLPQMEMMTIVSKILDDYDLDVWIWYPALDKDYSDSATVEFALREWGAVFEKLPRVDAIFVPGGDPGHTAPKHMMALLEKQTQMLHRFHPEAEMWMSPQGFTQEWMEEFYGILRQEPTWLAGLVYGPQVRVTLPQLRASIPSRYRIRRYPDITHTLHNQYPVPDWDLSYSLTIGREPINPRPRSQAQIFRVLQDYAEGFITYSEGCNDDVNKTIWSALGWNPDEDVLEILRQYSRYYIGESYEDTFAQGLLALEKNWQGPLITNESVYTTLEQFQAMEGAASPQDLLNWRFQQALYRAYYDAYVRRRLLYETGSQERAMDKLRTAQRLGSVLALDQAEAILDRARSEHPALQWRARIFELAEALYQSIRMQLSVERYKAIAVRRGANLDSVDEPLNDHLWLKQQIADVRKLSDEKERLARIDKIVSWSDPGPGGFYDDLGNLTAQTHLLRGHYDKDPGFLASSLVGFACRPGWRMSWCRHADALYDAPVQLRYTDLDPRSRYKVRVVYAGDNFRTRVRLAADNGTEIHSWMAKPRPIRPVEFDVPVEATVDGELVLTWQQTPGRGGNGRGCQVAEVWFMKIDD